MACKIVKIVLGLIVAVLIFALLETVYVLFVVGISVAPVKVVDMSMAELMDKLYKRNELARAPPDLEERIAAALKEAAGGRELLAVYMINRTDYLALFTKGLDLFYLRVKINNNISIAGEMRQIPRKVVRTVEQTETVYKDNMTMTLVVRYAIYEYSHKTENGTLYLYSIGPIGHKSRNESLTFYNKTICIKGYFYNWLPNEFGVCAGGVWWVDVGKAVLRFYDESYAWDSGAVERCSFTKEISDDRPYAVGVRATGVWATCPAGPTVKRVELWADIAVDYMLNVFSGGSGSGWVAMGRCCTS